MKRTLLSVVAIAALGVCGVPAVVSAQGPIVFKTPSGLLLFRVKQDRLKEFETAVTAFNNALKRSSRPARQRQAQGLKIYRAAEDFNGYPLYVLYLERAEVGADYSLDSIIKAELPPQEAQRVLELFAKSMVPGITRLSLTPTEGLAAPSTSAPASAPIKDRAP